MHELAQRKGRGDLGQESQPGYEEQCVLAALHVPECTEAGNPVQLFA